MKVEIVGSVGEPQLLADGNENKLFRQGRYGEAIISNLHGKFWEINRQGRLFKHGITSTALSANSITLTATTTPIIGLWNPPGSGVVLVPLRAICQVTSFPGNNAAAGGGFVWAKSSGNLALTLGVTGINAKSWVQNSVGKAFNLGTALTGITNALVVERGAAFAGPITNQPAAFTVSVAPSATPEDFDGLEMIQEGGLFCLLNTISTTAVLVAPAIFWAEFPKDLIS